MEVYNCGVISSLATQKPNDGAAQHTKAISGSVGEEVELGRFVSSEHIDHSFYLMPSAAEAPWEVFYYFR